MEFQDIIYTKEDGIATITLNRPEVLNSFSPSMIVEWAAAIEDAKKDDDVRVLIVTGTGRGFCAGMDVKALSGGKGLASSFEAPPAERRNFLRDSVHSVPRTLANFDKPYIGSINGPCAGAGMDMASMCDIRIASDRATFRMAYVRMGVAPGDGGCYFLPRIIGIARACELIWTGRIMDADEALSMGYVSKVVPHNELAAATKELAGQLASGPAVAIQLDKRLIYRCLDLDLNTALELHESAILMTLTTEDAKEGPMAWVERREPEFKGK